MATFRTQQSFGKWYVIDGGKTRIHCVDEQEADRIVEQEAFFLERLSPDFTRFGHASLLAKAERYARENGWTFVWTPEPIPCECPDSGQHTFEGCVLLINGTVEESIRNLCFLTPDDRRMHEADLASMAMLAIQEGRR